MLVSKSRFNSFLKRYIDLMSSNLVGKLFHIVALLYSLKIYHNLFFCSLCVNVLKIWYYTYESVSFFEK